MAMDVLEKLPPGTPFCPYRNLLNSIYVFEIANYNEWLSSQDLSMMFFDSMYSNPKIPLIVLDILTI